jgi:acyl carrier protein
MADNASKIKDIIEKELGVEREKLTPEASFIEDLGADSLDIVELVMEFEKEFNIDIPDEDAEKLRTVGDAIAYLRRRSRADAAAGRRHGSWVRSRPSATTWRRPGRALLAGRRAVPRSPSSTRQRLQGAVRLRGEGLRPARCTWTARRPSAPTCSRSTRMAASVQAMPTPGLAEGVGFVPERLRW